MNYLHAKAVLQKGSPEIPFNLIALEAATLVAAAGILVLLFA